MEPDDAYRWPEALQAKRGLGDYPTAPMARSSASFRELWRLALKEPCRFSTNRQDAQTDALRREPLAVTRSRLGDGRSQTRGPENNGPEQQLVPPIEELLVKTVNASLCAEVIAGWLGAKVIVLSRDLRKVISSWTLMDGFEPEDLHLDPWVSEHVLSGIQTPQLKTRLERIAWTVAILDMSLKATLRNKTWVTVAHEELVEDPHGKTFDLLASCGLECDDRVHDFIDSRRAPGAGYETRRSSAQLRGWEARLTKSQWAQVDAVLKLLVT